MDIYRSFFACSDLSRSSICYFQNNIKFTKVYSSNKIINIKLTYCKKNRGNCFRCHIVISLRCFENSATSIQSYIHKKHGDELLPNFSSYTIRSPCTTLLGAVEGARLTVFRDPLPHWKCGCAISLQHWSFSIWARGGSRLVNKESFV